METILVVCAIISAIFALWAAKPWRLWPWFKRQYWRLRRIIEDRREPPEPDDPIERFLQSRASGALFKTDRLYE